MLYFSHPIVLQLNTLSVNTLDVSFIMYYSHMAHKIKNGTSAGPLVTYRFSAKMLSAYIVLTIVFFGALLLAALQIGIIRENIFSLLALTLFALPAVILIAFNTIIRRSRGSWAGLGYVPPGRRLVHLIWQVPLLLTALIATQGIFFGLLGAGADPSASNALDDIPLQVGWQLAILAVIGIGILVPVVEETLFRGVIYNFAKWRFGVIIGAILSASAFAIVHLSPILIPYLLTLGIGLAFIYEFHKTLWATVIVHGLLNSAITLALVFATS